LDSSITPAQEAKPVRPQVSAHVPAGSHGLTGNNAPRRILAGCLENHDPGVELAQAWTRGDEHTVGQ
jgi:hypothetical protein